MTSGISTVIVPVRDLDAAKKLYTVLLGVPPYTDHPRYVGFRVGDQEIGLDPHGHWQGMPGPIPYAQVEAIETVIDSVVAAGGKVRQPSRDVGDGRLIATVEDADGNVIGLIQG